MTPSQSCPDENTWLEHLAGQLPEDGAAGLERHLEGCAACRALVASTSQRGPTPGPLQRQLSPGERVGRFVVEEHLGRGGMGDVYRAQDLELQRPVALKIWRSGEQLFHEARAAARASHPNLVTVFDVGLFEDRVFLAMELMAGGTLSAWLRQRPRTWQEVRKRFLEAGAGLGALHNLGMIHRDFKPDNILLDELGKARVADYGLVQETGQSQTGGIAGTPAFMAPEQRSGAPATVLSDQFSFCASFRQALVDAGPPDVPRWLLRAIARGLSSAPEDRHPTLSDLLKAINLDRIQARRRSTWLPVAFAAALLALVGAAWFLRSEKRCQSQAGRWSSLWSPAAREEVSSAFQRSGKPYAHKVLGILLDRLDRYSQRGAREQLRACRARERAWGRHRQEQAAGVEDCLSRGRMALESMVVTARSADPRFMETSLFQVSRLPELNACEAAPQTSGPRPPADQVDPLRREVAASWEESREGRFLQSAQRAEEAAHRAETLGATGLEAELKLEAADGWMRVGRGQDAQRRLTEAELEAESAGDLKTAAEAYVQLTRLYAAMVPDFPQARAAAAHADALSQQLHRPGPLEFGRLSALSTLDRKQGHFDAAVTHARQALAQAEQLYTSDSPELYPAYGNLANALLFAGQTREGCDATETVARLLKELDPHHPMLGQQQTMLGICLGQLDRHRESYAAFEEAVRLETQVKGPGSDSVARNHANLGNAALHLGRVKEAERLVRQAIAEMEALLPPAKGELEETYALLGDVQLQKGNFRQARAAYQHVLSLHPSSERAKEGIARSKARQGAL